MDTSDSIQIGTLPNDRWQEYKELRLEALQESPQAFGSSYEEESIQLDEFWKKRMTPEILFATDGEKLVGMVGFFNESHIKNSHIAYIWGIYVKKQYRGNGLGTRLLQAIIEKIKPQPQTTKIKISANASEHIPVHLYKRVGFQTAGIYKNEMKIGDTYYDEVSMEMMIK